MGHRTLDAAGKDKELVLVIAERDPQAASFVAELNSETGVPRMPVIADGDRQIMEHYKIRGVPYIVTVGADGRIESKGSAATYASFGAGLRESRRKRRVTATSV